jgi:uncharacterized protein
MISQLKIFKIALLSIASFYLLLLISVYFLQTHFLYQPIDTLHLKNAVLPKPWQIVNINTRDHLNLNSWYVPATKNMPTILFLHGKSGDIADRFDYAMRLHQSGYGVFLLEYRGFSDNPGTPAEKGFLLDSASAFHWLTAQGVLSRDIVIYGEALGSAVALELGAAVQSRAIILESPFYSLTAMSHALYPWLPTHLLLKEKYESFHYAKKVKSPVMILYSLEDTRIPYTQVEHLAKRFPEKNQALLVLMPETIQKNKPYDLLADLVTVFVNTSQNIPRHVS